MQLIMKPTSAIKTRLKIQEGGPAHKFFTHTCRIHMDKFVPFRDGNLSTIVNERVNSITYKSPYAHYMYEGKVMGPNIPIVKNGTIVGWFSPKGKKKEYTGADINYSTSRHAYAGPHWDKRMWSAEREKVEKEVENFIKRGGK